MENDKEIGTHLIFEKKCIICHTEKLFPKEEKHIFGLFSYNTFACDQCGVLFREDGGKWKLAKISDKNNSIWQKYGNQALLAREWKNIGDGGLSDKEQMIADKLRRDAEIEAWMKKISSGSLKVKVIRAEPPIILQKDEEALCVLPSIYLCETRAVRVNRGGYGGASFRVSKGVSLRLGQFGSRGESHPEMRNVDQGTLVITSRRFIYCGRIKTVDIPLRKILQVDPFDDAIGLHKENREKTQYFTWTNTDTIEAAIKTRSESRVRSELKRINEMGLDTNGEIELDEEGGKDTIPLTGNVLKSILEGVIRNI